MAKPESSNAPAEIEALQLRIDDLETKIAKLAKIIETLLAAIEHVKRIAGIGGPLPPETNTPE